ncbi:MAG: Trk family potassium uptake protein [Chloroflexi bacterium]|nr:Trk family potassium uptake protein [Chloroflexota bacterium]
MNVPAPQYRRRPGDIIIRPLRLPPERVVVTPRKLPRRPLPPALVLAASFAAAIALGTLALMLPISSAGGEWTSPRVAIFTATSAVTLTGLVLVDTGTYWSGLGQAVILLMIQLGGLGFMTGASLVFMLLGRRLTLRERLLVREAVGAFGIGEATRLARNIALMMFSLEAVAAVILFLRFVGERPPGKALWFAVFHAVSALNNAGFDIAGDFRSLIGYQSDPVVVLTVAALIMAGGLSYITLANIARQRSFVRLSLDSKIVLVTSVVLWVLGTAAVLVAEWNNRSTLGPLAWPDKLLNAFFQSVTARTAGFNTVDTAGLTEHSLFLLVGLMFIGGAAASTAGGIRLNTFSALLVAIIATVLGRSDVQAFRRTIPPALVYRALAIALLSVAFVFVVAYLLAFTEEAPFLHLLFETVSAFGTVGLTTGITPNLSPVGSLIIVMTMLVGRLGPLTLAVLLAGRLTAPRIHYAQEPVRVG